jgi:hypothetical protein
MFPNCFTGEIGEQLYSKSRSARRPCQ